MRLNRPRLNFTVTVCAAFAAPGGETVTLVIVRAWARLRRIPLMM